MRVRFCAEDYVVFCVGQHISQAARIEPITPPGEVYASESFAALSASEGVDTFVCEYVGRVPLAKAFGTFPLFHVKRRSNRIC
jgi:class 3 adenylate cyclase